MTSRATRMGAVAAAIVVAGLTSCSSSSPSPTAAAGPSSPEPQTAPTPIVDAGTSSTSSVVRELRKIELQRLELLVAGDVDRAAALHADDFELVPPPGYPMGRDEYLDAVETGDLDYRRFAPASDIEVRVSGTSAVLWYLSQIDVDVAGLGRFQHDTWHLYLYEKRAGAWQVVREQATAVGGFPPAAG